MGQALVKGCPVCKKPTVEKFRPFCSARCADIDLGGWFSERYRVETTESEDQESEGLDENDEQ